MLSAATPGTSRATSTVRADGSTTPLSIGFRVRLRDRIAAPELLDDRGEPVGAEHATLVIDDDVVAEREPHAAEEARCSVGQRGRIEQQEHAAAGLQMARRAPPAPRGESRAAVRRRSPDRSRRAAAPSSRLTTSTVKPCASSPATRRPTPCASPLGTRSPWPVVSTARRRRPRTASRMPPASCSSGCAGTTHAAALVLERRAPVLRDAVSPRALGIAVEVEQLVGDAAGSRCAGARAGRRSVSRSPRRWKTVMCSGSVDLRQRRCGSRATARAPVSASGRCGGSCARRAPGAGRTRRRQHRLERELRPAPRRAARAASAQPPPAPRVERQQREGEEGRGEEHAGSSTSRVSMPPRMKTWKRSKSENGRSSAERALAHRRLVPGDDPEEQQHAVRRRARHELAVGERGEEEPAGGEGGGEQQQPQVAREQRAPGDRLEAGEEQRVGQRRARMIATSTTRQARNLPATISTSRSG